MALMDLLKSLFKGAAQTAAKKLTTKTETFTFGELPADAEALKALPEAELDTPFRTAALTVIALCTFTKDAEAGAAMFEYLRGPNGPLSQMNRQFLRDRFMDGKTYVPFSFFEGATPENDYTPAQPFVLKVSDNPYSYQNEGYATLYLRSGGADSVRPVNLRKAGSGKWYLNGFEQLVGDIRVPKSKNPWA